MTTAGAASSITAGIVMSLVLAGCGAGAPAGALGAAAGSATGSASASRRPNRPPPEVAVLVAALADTPRHLAFPASVEAAEQVDVTARVAGIVDTVLVREGDAVAAGQPLALIADLRLRASACSAQAAVGRAAARLAEEHAAVERRERAAAGISVDELSAARLRYEVAEADLAQARADLRARTIDLEDAVIRAPISGAIDTRPVRPGQQVAVGTRIATMIQRLPLHVRAAVVESEALRLRPGMPAFATAGAATAAGSVVHVGQRADPATRMADVVVRLDGDPGWLAGAFVRLHVEVERGSAPWLPIAALRTGERGPMVWVLDRSDGTQRVRERPVVLGLQDGREQVEIRAGIVPGDEVLVAGIDGLWNGREVRLRGSASAARAPGSATAATPGRPR
jgi:multidrug efflux system membrane fusion protein